MGNLLTLKSMAIRDAGDIILCRDGIKLSVHS